MLKHITAALAAFFLLLPGSVFAESLDLSKLGDIEEAEQWEERAWYQREDARAARASSINSSHRKSWVWIFRFPTSKASSRLTT